VKLDVDANPATAAHYGIRGIPAVKAFRDGRVVDEFVGVRSPQLIASFLDGLLGPTPADRLIDELRASGEHPAVLAALEANDHERALELLLERARETSGEERDEVRRLMVELFNALGQEDPLAVRYRKQLAAALY
jgi:putative thioredoxin